MNDIQQLSERQLHALRSLHFWLRNLQVASIHRDLPECQKSREAISDAFKSCDRLSIPFVVQNRVIYAASQQIVFRNIVL